MDRFDNMRVFAKVVESASFTGAAARLGISRLVELFDAQGVSFVSVTQQFNTTSSMGRLTLNKPDRLDFIEFIFHPTRCRRPICVSHRQSGGMSKRRPARELCGFSRPTARPDLQVGTNTPRTLIRGEARERLPKDPFCLRPVSARQQFRQERAGIRTGHRHPCFASPRDRLCAGR